MNVLDLFSGIGGFTYGLESVGFNTVAFCENEPYMQSVLNKHWPEIKIYDDVRKLTKRKLDTDEITIDVITGGWPCQPVSQVGKRKGKSDDRYLWPEMFRVISEVRPRWVIGENVAGIVKMGIDSVLSDLEGVGYTTQTFDLPAASVGANHQRRRMFIVGHNETSLAYTPGEGLQGQPSPSLSQRQETVRHNWSRHRWLPTPRICRRGDGVQKRMDRLKGIGNSVVPALVAEIGGAILAAEHFAHEQY